MASCAASAIGLIHRFTAMCAQEYSRRIGPAKWKFREISASDNSGCTADYAALIRPTAGSALARAQDFQHRVEAEDVGVHAEAGNHALSHVGQHAVDVALGNVADVHLHV